MKRVGRVLMIVLLAISGIGAYSAAAQESLVWSFEGYPTDGSKPNAGLISDAEGNLYGTTVYGGAYGNGAVIELSPTESGGWTEKLLYSFLGGNGGALDPQNPLGSLVFDKSGNLYGTTVGGGTNNGGTIFELSPGADGVWTEQLLYSFAQGNQTAQTGPSQPQANLILDTQGNLYGTSLSGGKDSFGTVFELVKPSAGGTWTEKTLWNFLATGGADGFNPRGGLIWDAEGNLYGTTSAGGSGEGNGTGLDASGAVFELSPGKGGVWTEKLLWSFGAGAYDGTAPQAGLIFDSKGNLYGTTHTGGATPYNTGTVFELSPNGGNAPWTEKLLWSFGGAPSDGAQPYDTLIFDAQGNLYGTTLYGGPNGYAALQCYCAGTAFELSPASGGAWTETILHDFLSTSTDGFEPSGGLIADAAGNLYSTTYGGGAKGNNGTVFKLEAAGLLSFTPPAGTYVGTQTVRITSAPADATIYYTTDGTTPTTASTKYTGAIEVPESETFKAFAFAAGYPNGAVITAAYTILERPTVGLTLSSDAITTLQALTVGVALNSVAGRPTPTGSVTVTSGSYTSAAAILSGGKASIVIPAGSLTAGADTLTVTYTPDKASSLVYTPANAAAGVTVQRVTPTLTWPAPVAVTYGTALTSKQLNAVASVPGTFAYKPAPGTVPTAGTQTLSVTFTPADTAQYNQVTGSAALVVNKASLAVTANEIAKVYGAAMPELTYTISGFVNSETQSTATTGAPSLTTIATAKYNVGVYAITTAKGTLAAANYTLKFVPGTLTITKALLTVTAINRTKVYGAAFPNLGYAITGFVNGDLQVHAVSGVPSITTVATAKYNVGSYPIVVAAGTMAARDYSFKFVSGAITITKALLTVSADNRSKVVGAAVPSLPYAITGFVNGDLQVHAVSGSPILTTTATANSPAGTYPITPALGTLAARDYTFAFKDGTLTVMP